MLHAKELRFGNKVFNQKGEVITVQQILSNTIVYDTQINVSREIPGGKGYYSSSSSYAARVADTAHVIEVVKEAELQDVEPITLTPKILEQCGFRNFIRDEWILTYGNMHTDFEFTEDGLKLRHPTPCRVSIKYLHQLQNFFYAIAGLELEINL